MESPAIVTTIAGLWDRVKTWRREGARIALVPTMGALHEGHLSLVARASERADRTIVSIFVNPAQFAPHEDFDRYPRDLDQDCGKLAAQGSTDLVFAPAPDELYPQSFATRIEMAGPALGLETDFRPHFFSGVATVVAKLLIAASPDVAVFGEKDYQQLLVVRRLVRDLALGVEIISASILREADGLAMSSRNAYLTPPQRRVASQLPRVLADVATQIRDGAAVSSVEESGQKALLAAGFENVDYLAVRDAETLAKPEGQLGDLRVLAAAWVGKTRLIDNMPIGAPSG